MRTPRAARLAPFFVSFLAAACASSVVAVEQRAVHDDVEALEWKPATAADVAGHWRVHSLQGPAAAVLMDLAYWIDADGSFTGAALFPGPPPSYEVLSGTWSLGAEGSLQLGEGSEPARAEVAGNWLRLSGAEGSLVLERAEVR